MPPNDKSRPSLFDTTDPNNELGPPLLAVVIALLVAIFTCAIAALR